MRMQHNSFILMVGLVAAACSGQAAQQNAEASPSATQSNKSANQEASKGSLPKASQDVNATAPSTEPADPTQAPAVRPGPTAGPTPASKDQAAPFVENTLPAKTKPGASQKPKTPSSGQAKNDCVKSGCSSQLCIESGHEVITTCDFKPEYACYKTAICTRQPNGQCGFTQTAALVRCLKGSSKSGAVIQ